MWLETRIRSELDEEAHVASRALRRQAREVAAIPVRFARRKPVVTAVAVVVPLAALAAWALLRRTPSDEPPACRPRRRGVASSLLAWVLRTVVAGFTTRLLAGSSRTVADPADAGPP